MTSFTTNRSLMMMLALVLALGLAYGGPVAAAEGTDDEQHERRIVVKYQTECDGDDCEDGPHAIFIDDDGDGEHGSRFHWVGGHEGAMQALHLAHGGGFLGVGMTELSPELRTHFGVPEAIGVMVSKIVDDSPAQNAGLEVGDIITLVDGEEIASGRALARAIGGKEEGETVSLEIWRDGSVLQLSANVEQRQGRGRSMMPRIHMRHGGGHEGMHEGMIAKHIEIHCGDDDDCNIEMGPGEAFDCGADECEVKVLCTEDGCDCTVNGEQADCADIPGVPHQ